MTKLIIMKFDEQNMENLSNLLLDKIKNMESDGNPKINEIIYMFQQEVLPKIVYNSIQEF